VAMAQHRHPVSEGIHRCNNYVHQLPWGALMTPIASHRLINKYKPPPEEDWGSSIPDTEVTAHEDFRGVEEGGSTPRAVPDA
jgi:hypothetical protein